MSSGNATHNTLTEALDSALAEDAPQGRLEDSEIQRLVALSRDAAYQRSERVPVKTVEAFEPRSLVSIAMEAQRRRETEMRTAAAAGAEIDETVAEAPAEVPDGQSPDPDTVSGSEVQSAAGGESADAAGADEAVPGADGDAATAQVDDAEGVQTDEMQKPSSTSQVDYEAGRQAGLEEGRQVGFAEGQAKGMEEGRTAGRAEASAQLERAIQSFEAAAAKLADMADLDSSALGESINAAIIALASERAGYAIAERPDGLADRVERLLATVQAVSGNPEIRLNEADLASIKPLVETREKLRHCSFVADPDLASGDLSVTLGTIGIDDIMRSPIDTAAMAEASEMPEVGAGHDEPAGAGSGADSGGDKVQPDADLGTAASEEDAPDA